MYQMNTGVNTASQMSEREDWPYDFLKQVHIIKIEERFFSFKKNKQTNTHTRILSLPKLANYSFLNLYRIKKNKISGHFY